MNPGVGLNVSFLAVWCVAMFSNSESLTTLLMVSLAAQTTLFVIVACLPYLRTGRMSYVDIAWPFGVALNGVLMLVLGDGFSVRTIAVGGIYLFIGLRMGIGALEIANRTGVIVKSEFPRYVYRRTMLEASGTSSVKFHILTEIMAQGLANASVLALPGFLLATNTTNVVSPWEIVGLCIWGTAYVIESVADAQKLIFLSKNKGEVCTVGLWRYSRHPNYFAEWLVWTGIVIAAVPSWLGLRATEGAFVWIALGVGAIGASIAMYLSLVYITGVIPAEYFSERKRPGYREYQATTNRFFPGRPRNSSSE